MQRCSLLLLLFACAGLHAQAQQNCPLAPSVQSVSARENIFSDQQEVDLGDAMAETIALHVNVIQNDDSTVHLRELGNRLVHYLPPTKLNFRFYLIDLPQVNAFSIAGGRVYVSRKIVAFAHNDDEIAGVLAHELGHIVMHQSAIEMTRAFREVLGVTQVGDREDVFRKFHLYVESIARQRRRNRGEEEKHQIVADQVSIYALARAGFNVQAFPDFWDRFAELHGKTGNWFTDLFGTTTPAQLRLRDMIKNMGALPPGCAERTPSANEAKFKAWQDSVLEYDSGTRTEILPGLISERRLSARLRPDITNLRFSPNGKFILAQDDGGIHVVSRDPFAFLFYIPAADAHEAKFSPDSNAISFSTSSMRVEAWSVPDHKRKWVREVTVRAPCLQSELSPDGSTLACFDGERRLQLINVNSGTVLVEQNDFFPASMFMMTGVAGLDEDTKGRSLLAGSVRLVNMSFSPDGRYFLASTVDHPQYDYWEGKYVSAPPQCFVYDLRGDAKVPVPANIKSEAGGSFAFLGPDRIVGINAGTPQKSHILKFPSGEILGDAQFWQGLNLRAAAHGDFLLVGPVKDYPLGVMDLATKENKIVIKQNAADIYDGIILTEQINGQLALHTKDKPDALAVLPLPEGNLGQLRASAASPDLSFLAVSSRTRGAVWELPADLRAVQMRRFNAVGFDGPAVYADLPEFQGFARQTAEMHLDTGAHSFHEIKKEEIAVQRGLYMLVTKPHKKGSGNANTDLEVRDVRSGAVLWSRYFADELPRISFDPDNATAILSWQVSQTAARKELQGLSQLNQRAEKDDYLCEILDAGTGKMLSAFVLKTNGGSVRPIQASANQNWAVINAELDQIITYALPSGKEGGQFFGSHPVLSSSGLLAFDSERREVAVYDLATSEQRQQYTFAQPVACKIFSADGKRLLVFTADQTVYLFDVTSAAATESVSVSN